ncbi:MAG: hypothetical protein C5B47_06365 [Verrucomicrobia bacterium]|nr:MAG: hypothetical protein C5B47_06365 [Verrucomicrobiota bacterium]
MNLGRRGVERIRSHPPESNTRQIAGLYDASTAYAPRNEGKTTLVGKQIRAAENLRSASYLKIGLQNSMGHVGEGANVLGGNHTSSEVSRQLDAMKGSAPPILSGNKIGNIGPQSKVLSDWRMDSMHPFASGNVIDDLGEGAQFGHRLNGDD